MSTKNLKSAFAGQFQARNKYTVFTEVARREGDVYITGISEETAENERQHARGRLPLLGGIGDTAANLKEVLGGEDDAVESMYPTVTGKPSHGRSSARPAATPGNFRTGQHGFLIVPEPGAAPWEGPEASAGVKAHGRAAVNGIVLPESGAGAGARFSGRPAVLQSAAGRIGAKVLLPVCRPVLRNRPAV